MKRMTGWMGGWVGEWIDKRTYIYVYMDEWMEGRKDRLIDRLKVMGVAIH